MQPACTRKTSETPDKNAKAAWWGNKKALFVVLSAKANLLEHGEEDEERRIVTNCLQKHVQKKEKEIEKD